LKNNLILLESISGKNTNRNAPKKNRRVKGTVISQKKPKAALAQGVSSLFDASIN